MIRKKSKKKVRRSKSQDPVRSKISSNTNAKSSRKIVIKDESSSSTSIPSKPSTSIKTSIEQPFVRSLRDSRGERKKQIQSSSSTTTATTTTTTTTITTTTIPRIGQQHAAFSDADSERSDVSLLPSEDVSLSHTLIHVNSTVTAPRITLGNTATGSSGDSSHDDSDKSEKSEKEEDKRIREKSIGSSSIGSAVSTTTTSSSVSFTGSREGGFPAKKPVKRSYSGSRPGAFSVIQVQRSRPSNKQPSRVVLPDTSSASNTQTTTTETTTNSTSTDSNAAGSESSV